MTIDLSGHTSAITGAASGIGRAIAEAFLEAGANVLALDINEAALETLKSERPSRVTSASVDITDYAALCRIASLHNIDHLVCAAAIGSGKAGFPFWNLEPADWQRVIEVTLMGTVNSLQAFLPSLRSGETTRKSVLFLSSVAGQIGSQTDPPYSASKAAVINFAKCAAKDLAPDGIRVNNLSPGMVKTTLNKSVFEANRDDENQTYEAWAADKIEKISPLGRWQEPSEFGAMAVFLASKQGRNITGQTLNIDGGQVMHS